MQPYDVIRSKRDTKLLDSRSIPADTRRRILQAGRMAGSAKHSQPVRFVVVEDAALRQTLAACGDFTAQLAAAPLVIALVVLPGSGQHDPERAVQFDAGRAAQNMMLAAWAGLYYVPWPADIASVAWPLAVPFDAIGEVIADHLLARRPARAGEAGRGSDKREG